MKFSSAKLYELDREFGLLHGSISSAKTASREQLGQELARLRQKNEADRLAFQTKLKFSRSPMVGKLASSYETIEAFIDRERAEQDGPFSEVWRRGLSAEEALLLAEYSLDFAAQAANHALLLSWKQSAPQDIPRGRKRRLSKMRRRSKFGWMELMIGILLIVLGIFTFLRPGSVLTGAVLVYGVFALITGIADIVFYVKMERHTGFGPVVALVSGILSVIAGLLVMVYPRRRGLGADDLLPPMVHHALHLPPDPLGDHPVCGRQRVLLFQPDPEHHRAGARLPHAAPAGPRVPCPWALSSGPI